MNDKKKRNRKLYLITFAIVAIIGLISTSALMLAKSFDEEIEYHPVIVLPPEELNNLKVDWPYVYDEKLNKSINYDGSVNLEYFSLIYSEIIWDAFYSGDNDYYNDFGISYEIEQYSNTILVKCKADNIVYNNTLLSNKTHTYKYYLHKNSII